MKELFSVFMYDLAYPGVVPVFQQTEIKVGDL